MTVAEVLAEAGIGKDGPAYNLQYNLAHAGFFGGLGVRAGSHEEVKRVMERHGLAPVVPARVDEFAALLHRVVEHPCESHTV